MKPPKLGYIVLAGMLLVALAVAGAKLANHSKEITLPAGTVVQVSLAHAISSDQAKSGDDFDATVAAPVMFDGKIVIAQGAEAHGRVVDARESGRLEGVARLRLALDEVDSYDVETTAVTRTGQSHTKRNWAMIGGGTAGGALIGGLAGGGKGAAIGAGVGAGAGTAAAAYTGKKDIRLPAETILTFRLTQPVNVDVKP